jgi:hypothetical protein
MVLSKGNYKIRFDRKIAAGKGNSMSVQIIPDHMEHAHAATNMVAKTIDLNDLH